MSIRKEIVILIGKIIKYDSSRELGIVLCFDNHRTYQFRKSSSVDGDVGYGYIVFFHVCYDEKYHRRFAQDISVIESSNGIYSEKKDTSKHKKNHKKHKSCNADRYDYDNRKFNKFVKQFMREQKKEN